MSDKNDAFKAKRLHALDDIEAITIESYVRYCGFTCRDWVTVINVLGHGWPTAANYFVPTSFYRTDGK